MSCLWVSSTIRQDTCFILSTQGEGSIGRALRVFPFSSTYSSPLALFVFLTFFFHVDSSFLFFLITGPEISKISSGTFSVPLRSFGICWAYPQRWALGWGSTLSRYCHQNQVHYVHRYSPYRLNFQRGHLSSGRFQFLQAGFQSNECKQILKMTNDSNRFYSTFVHSLLLPCISHNNNSSCCCFLYIHCFSWLPFAHSSFIMPLHVKQQNESMHMKNIKTITPIVHYLMPNCQTVLWSATRSSMACRKQPT